MKILIISTSVVPVGYGLYGGIERPALDYARIYAEKGHKVIMAAPLGSTVPEGIEWIPTVKLPEEQDRDDIVEEKVRLANPDYDIIHDFTHHHVFKRPEDKAVHMMFDPIAIRFDFKAKQNVTCYSNWQRGRFEKAYGQKGLTMPCNAIDTTFFKPADGVKRERFLFVGKMSPNKGAHLALQYCEQLGLPLDIIGGLIPSDDTGYVRLMKNRVSGSKNVSFAFNVTEEEKRDLMQNAKALIYPEMLDDCHWLTGVETWACHTPTIAYDHGSLSEITDPGWGAVVKDEKAFKEKMQDQEWLQSRDFSGFDDRHNMRKTTDVWLDLYRRVVAGETWS